jgi:hypothetical protein
VLRCGGVGILLLEQQSGGGVAVPGIGVFEEFDEFGGGALGESGSRATIEVGWSDAVDASAVAASFQVQHSFEVIGHGPWVFDGFAVHVEEVEGAVGSMYEVYRSEPVVGGGEEFAVLVDATGAEGGAGGGELLAVNEIGGDIGEEDL